MERLLENECGLDQLMSKIIDETLTPGQMDRLKVIQAIKLALKRPELFEVIAGAKVNLRIAE